MPGILLARTSTITISPGPRFDALELSDTVISESALITGVLRLARQIETTRTAAKTAAPVFANNETIFLPVNVFIKAGPRKYQAYSYIPEL